MMKHLFLLLFICTTLVSAAPPEDPQAQKVYDHNYKWLSTFPANFIATNIRGDNDQQYPQRRQAALDLLREKRDLTTVPELMDELRRQSFLSADICDMLGDWKAKKALPLLTEVAADTKRPSDVRQKAEKAIHSIKTAAPEAAPPAY